MFPSFPRYKEGTGGRPQIEPGPPVILGRIQEPNFTLILQRNISILSTGFVHDCSYLTTAHENFPGSLRFVIRRDSGYSFNVT